MRNLYRLQKAPKLSYNLIFKESGAVIAHLYMAKDLWKVTGQSIRGNKDREKVIAKVVEAHQAELAAYRAPEAIELVIEKMKDGGNFSSLGKIQVFDFDSGEFGEVDCQEGFFEEYARFFDSGIESDALAQLAVAAYDGHFVRVRNLFFHRNFKTLTRRFRTLAAQQKQETARNPKPLAKVYEKEVKRLDSLVPNESLVSLSNSMLTVYTIPRIQRWNNKVEQRTGRWNQPRAKEEFVQHLDAQGSKRKPEIIPTAWNNAGSPAAKWLKQFNN